MSGITEPNSLNRPISQSAKPVRTPTDLSNQDRNETAPTLRNRHQHDSNTKPPHSSMSFHPFAFCLFTPTLGLALTLFCGPVPFISGVSSPSTLTALGRRLLFVTLGLAFALVPWLPPPLVLVPCWLCVVTMPTLVGAWPRSWWVCCGVPWRWC